MYIWKRKPPFSSFMPTVVVEQQITTTELMKEQSKKQNRTKNKRIKTHPRHKELRPRPVAKNAMSRSWVVARIQPATLVNYSRGLLTEFCLYDSNVQLMVVYQKIYTALAHTSQVNSVFLRKSDWFPYLPYLTIHLQAKQDGVPFCLSYRRTFLK